MYVAQPWTVHARTTAQTPLKSRTLQLFDQAHGRLGGCHTATLATTL
jgi:hypothetical protein